MYKNIPFLITLLLFSICTNIQAQDNTIDLVLLAGQSNMRGKGVFAELQPTTHPADTDLEVMINHRGQNNGPVRVGDFKGLYFHVNSSTGVNVESFGMAIPLARKLYDAGHTKLAIINGAVGGSNILDWQKGDHLYDNFRQRIEDRVMELEAAGYTVNLLGFGWQQGEANNISRTPSADYLAALTSMITDLKTDIEVILPSQGNELKTVLMEPVYGGVAQNVRPNVADAMIDYATNTINNTIYIQTRDITDRIAVGNIHWGTTGVTEVGDRLFRALTTKSLPDLNINNFIVSQPDWSGIWMEYWGFQNEFETGIQPYLHIAAGEPVPIQWRQIEKLPGVFDFSILQTRLERARDNDYYYQFELWAGSNSPDWIYEQGVPLVTVPGRNRTNPDYKNETFKYYQKRFYTALADTIASYDEDLRERLVFIMPGFGATGDRQLFKGTPEEAQFVLSDAEYLEYMQEMAVAITTAFWKNPETSHLRFRWNINDYNGEPEVTNPNGEQMFGAWIKQNYNAQIRKQQFTVAVGYMSPNEQNQDDELRDNFFGNDPNRWNGNPEYIVGEMQEERFAQTPIAELNQPLNYYWTSISSVDRGVDGWILKYNFMNTDFLEAYEFSERYSFHKKAATSPVAFIALRDVLDYSDEQRFPPNDFGGPAERNNETRINAILQEFEDYGASNDDSESVMNRSGVNYIEFANGYNDCTWNVIDRNYRRFITQINPNTTSKGYWRVGLDDNGAGEPYGRFARGFDIASNNNTMYFDVDDAYYADEIQNNKGGLKVKVIYYEDDGGSWRFRYRAQNGTMKTAGTIINNASAGNGWSSVEFLIEDAKLDNGGPFGSDFVLRNIGGTNVRFHLIELDTRVDTTNDQTLSINDALLNNNISIVPNPTNGVFTINAGNSVIKNVTIMDVQGRILRKLKGNDTDRMTINISELNSEIYFVTIETENGYQSLRVLKM